MDNYVDSTSPEYVRRMASVLNAKWEALAPYVTPGVRVLDYGCGMPVEGGIRERVEAAGGYDVVFLSSVVHEILEESNGDSLKELELIRQLVASGGVLVIRDWSGARFQVEEFSNLKSLNVVSVDAMREVLTWVGALTINKIIHFRGGSDYSVNWDGLKIEANPTNLYEIAFHSVWGLDSLPRESTESYSGTRSMLNVVINRWDEYVLEQEYDEWDEGYLEHFQRLYDIDRLPWPTKTVLVLRRNK